MVAKGHEHRPGQGGNPDYLWLDGHITPWKEATVHVTQLGWAGVSSVFEGIKAYRNPDTGALYVFRLDEHLARFADSMKMMRMNPAFPPGQLKGATLELLKANKAKDDTYIRPLAFFGEGFYCFASPEEVKTHIFISTEPFECYLRPDYQIDCCVSSWTRIADNVMPARVKAVPNYQNSRFASLEARLNGYDDAIMLNERGKVAEAPGACLMLVRGGTVITSSVTSGILESITRLTLIQLLRETLKIEVVEREVDRTELYIADEAFLCGTMAEVSPIASTDRLPVGEGKVGPITAKVRDLYHNVVRGLDPRYPEWRTEVR